MSKQWLLIVFDVPDRLGEVVSRLGLRQSKKRPTNWWITFNPANRGAKPLAEKIRAELLALNLKGSWKEADEKRPRRPQSLSTIKPRRERPRGKAARTEYDNIHYLRRMTKVTDAIATAAAVTAAKNARVKAEADKRNRELKKQAQQLRDREQMAQARRVHELYLLHHPAGSA